MRQVCIATLFLFASIAAYSQCTPNAPTGTFSITPDPDNVPCIEQGVPYSTTMYIENFGSFSTLFGPITVDSARIDSLINFPCGLNWQGDKTLYTTGQTGCIVVSGTTNDSIGQYALRIYMTVYVNAGPLGAQAFSGELTSIIAQVSQVATLLGVTIPIGNVDYYSRVITQGDTCPAIDTSGTATNLTASCFPIIDDVEVSISGANTICAGTLATLVATPVKANGTVTYSWNTGATTPSISVSPTVTTSYSVTVTDTAGTASATYMVTVNHKPFVAFSAADTLQGDSAVVVTIVNTSTGATSYAWNFGDGTTSVVQNPAPHTYTTNGTKTITLIATNGCGSDTTTQDVEVSGIGVSVREVKNNLAFYMTPNPSSGNITLSFTADSDAKGYDLKIFDLTGKIVYDEKLKTTSGTVQKQLDLSGLPKGVYTLQLASGNAAGTKKIQLN